MTLGRFADYLATLDEEALVGLLQARPEVRIEPVPRGFAQLAQRLDNAESLGAALHTVSRDALIVGEAIAVLDEAATLPTLVTLLDAPPDVVRNGVDALRARGLVWEDSESLRLPARLQTHWSAEIGGYRPVGKIARSARVEELRTAVIALGGAADGLRKPELIGKLAELAADRGWLARVVADLPEPARTRLDELRAGSPIHVGVRPYPASADTGTELLIQTGLLLRANGHVELPREAAVAAWLADSELVLTGRPEIPRASTDEAAVRHSAQAAAREALRELSTLLDNARSRPIATLKKGGVGTRERARLAKRLSMPHKALMLWIDLAHAAGLLALTDAGYAPTPAYDAWCASPPSTRWAELTATWWSLAHSPTAREVTDNKEQPPPLPLASGAGAIRRALLQAEQSEASMSALGKEIDWFLPLHGYDPPSLEGKVAAALEEGELLGVIAADRVSELGQHLVDVLSHHPADPVADVAQRCTEPLPETGCSVILQSDLTAVVSGEPDAAASRVLNAAADLETRSTAATWRFTPDSIRAALDTGWSAEDLLTKLRALTEHPLPQPLEYLITDAARRHGQVRVRSLQSCILGTEATLTEIMHTRALHTLHLSWLSPTVLASRCDLDDVLAQLRKAGMAPVAEDARGVTIAEQPPQHQAPLQQHASGPQRRSPIPATDLAKQLLTTNPEGASSPATGSATFTSLAQLNTNLSETELELLADAVDHHHDVVLTYQDRQGSRTTRTIRPHQLFNKWLDSWCHLREGQRDFTVSNIESVSPH